MMNPDGTDAYTFDIGGSGLRWSPDGHQVAFNGSSDQGIAVWIANSDGSEPRQVSATYEDIGIRAWLNDHMLLMGIRNPGDPVDPMRLGDPYSIVNYILDLRNGSMQPYSESFEEAVPLSSGDRWVAYNLYESPGLTIYSLNQAPQEIFVDLDYIDPSHFDVSPSGGEIVACGILYTNEGTEAASIYRWKVDNATETTRVYALDFCGPVRWSPDGKFIALLKIDDTLVIFDTDTNTVKYKHPIGPLVSSSFVWSPNSDAVLVSRHYGEPGPSPKELAKMDIKTGEITRLTNNDIVEYSPQWVIIR
jgi:Tol biopolymer transport system component